LRAGAPTDQIRTTVDKALAILKNPQLKSEARKKERRDQLRQVIYARFDFTEMAKRSLGSHWRRRTPEEREEFVQLFTDLLERAYVDRIESYNDETFIYLRENLDGSYAEVKSRIATHQGEEISLNYKVHLVNGEWKVYDIVAENISLVNNYRSQFNRVITNSSYEELIRKMKEKQAEGMAEEK
ncbi:MAG: phospholipid-binding protein MlaC, partial [Candidatus Binatia bacterium]